MQPRPGQSRTTEPLHVAMLPLGVPVHPGLDVAASAVVQEDAAAGGDWFDTLPVDDGALALVAGDVVGNGASTETNRPDDWVAVMPSVVVRSSDR